jgi:hypothetical protein
VDADSGSTTSSAPAVSAQRRSHSAPLAQLAAIESAVSGPGIGAIWTAAAVKARMA